MSILDSEKHALDEPRHFAVKDGMLNLGKLISLCLLLSLCSGCSNLVLLDKDDYEISQRDFLGGDAAQALRDFPSKWEEGDFITTMEKTYLSLLQGKPKLEALEKQAAALQNKIRYKTSPQGQTFFYAQTTEDYYPSEHEIIWLHLLLSWGYSVQAQYPAACNQAREARHLLSPTDNSLSHFDDPMLRVFLATLWTMCGEWREAKTDFHRAWALDNSFTWAETLAERDKSPANFFLVLGGPGPEVEANHKLPGVTCHTVEFRFRLRGLKSNLSIFDQHGVSVAAHLSTDAQNWYQWEIARELELGEMITNSAYVSAATGMSNTEAYAIAGFLGGGAWGLDVFKTTSSSVRYTQAALASMLVGTIIGAGYGAYLDHQEGADEGRRSPGGYRFVRYLPEYLWTGWSDQPVAYPVELRTPRYHAAVQQPTVRNNNVSISVAFIADAAP